MVETNSWYHNPYTGLFTDFGIITPDPHDPMVIACGGNLMKESCVTNVGGIGWDEETAILGCLGEAIERFQACPAPQDRRITSSAKDWPLNETFIPLEKWVLFSTEQYQQPDFPFQPFTETTTCRWVSFRQVPNGQVVWIPENFAYLGRTNHLLCPSVSTGLTCGQLQDPVLLRGVQEVIERDALMGTWWKIYPIECWETKHIATLLGTELTEKIWRPNLEYRFYRIHSPFSSHVTIVTIAGTDKEGFCFSVGSACRETRQASWIKSILEAIQGRYYVRHLKKIKESTRIPLDFEDHTIYYSFYPEDRVFTPFHSATTAYSPTDSSKDFPENLSVLLERLGQKYPVLFRNMTPLSIAQQFPQWYVLKVVVPGLQPMHGNHLFPHLGGQLWQHKTLTDWLKLPPHPFP